MTLLKASWCPPCRRETPNLKPLWERYGKSGKVAFVGVNFDHKEEAAKAFAEKNGLAWTQLLVGGWGQDNVVVREFGVAAIPSLWLVAPDGKVIAREIPFDDLEELLQKTLAN